MGVIEDILHNTGLDKLGEMTADELFGFSEAGRVAVCSTAASNIEHVLTDINADMSDEEKNRAHEGIDKLYNARMEKADWLKSKGWLSAALWGGPEAYAQNIDTILNEYESVMPTPVSTSLKVESTLNHLNPSDDISYAVRRYGLGESDAAFINVPQTRTHGWGSGVIQRAGALGKFDSYDEHGASSDQLSQDKEATNSGSQIEPIEIKRGETIASTDDERAKREKVDTSVQPSATREDLFEYGN